MTPHLFELLFMFQGKHFGCVKNIHTYVWKHSHFQIITNKKITGT